MIAGAIVGALCGVLAWLVVRFVVPKPHRSGWPGWLLLIGLFAVGLALGRQYVNPLVARLIVSESDVESSLAKLPQYQSIKEARPDLWAQIVEVVHAGAKKGRSTEAVSLEIRTTMLPQILDEAVLNADDPTLLAYYQIQTAALRHTLGVDPSGVVCMRFSNGQIGDSRPYLSEQLQRDDGRAFAALLRSASSKIPAVLLTEDEALSTLDPIIDRLIESYTPEQLGWLGDPNGPSVDPAIVCAMSVEMAEGVVALPPEQAAPMARWMLLGGGE